METYNPSLKPAIIRPQQLDTKEREVSDAAVKEKREKHLVILAERAPTPPHNSFLPFSFTFPVSSARHHSPPSPKLMKRPSIVSFSGDFSRSFSGSAGFWRLRRSFTRVKLWVRGSGGSPFPPFASLFDTGRTKSGEERTWGGAGPAVGRISSPTGDVT